LPQDHPRDLHAGLFVVGIEHPDLGNYRGQLRTLDLVMLKR
jgi:hypothetical protein